MTSSVRVLSEGPREEAGHCVRLSTDAGRWSTAPSRRSALGRWTEASSGDRADMPVLPPDDMTSVGLEHPAIPPVQQCRTD